MTVMMYSKGKKYNLLKENFNVPQPVLEALANLDVVFASSANGTAIELCAPSGFKKTHAFNTLVNNVVKNPTPQVIIEVNKFVADFVHDVKEDNAKKVANKAPQTASQASTLGTLLKSKLAADAAASEPVKAKATVGPPPHMYNVDPTGGKPAPLKATQVGLTQAQVNAMPAVKLRDATALYQKVYGTSSGSIYRVIAMNSDLRVAARIKGEAVSVRVEGILTDSVVTALTEMGIIKKSDEYMSGHFTCEKCTPQKLIGSLLVGAGIQFDTPIPVISSGIFA